MVSDVTIRAITPSDFEVVALIIQSCLTRVNSKDYPKVTIETMVQHFKPENLGEWFKDSHTVVALYENSIVGTGTLSGEEVRTVFVSPDSHGKGIGKAIMAYLEKNAKEAGQVRVVLKSSLTSLQFYEHLGYRKLQDIELPLGGKMVLMEKEI